MSSLEKQLTINQLNLPMDIINTLKSYLFYDYVESKSRNAKKNTVNLLKLISSFRNKNIYGIFVAIGFLNISYEKLQLQYEICSCCGKYTVCNTNNISFKVKCHCYNNN
jgi:hypothetical protein